MDCAQDSDLDPFLEDLRQSEKKSEIKPLLGLCGAACGLHTVMEPKFISNRILCLILNDFKNFLFKIW